MGVTNARESAHSDYIMVSFLQERIIMNKYNDIDSIYIIMSMILRKIFLLT